MVFDRSLPDIAQSIAELDRLGQQINTLVQLIQQRFDKVWSRSTNICHRLGDWQFADKATASNWLYQQTLLSHKLKTHDGQSMFLSIQISLFGEGVNSVSIDNERPIVHVCYSRCPFVDMENGISIQELLNEKVGLKHHILWYWPSLTSSPSEWLFSLKLSALDSQMAIDTQLLLPTLMLIKTDAVLPAFVQALEGIVRYYPQKNGRMRLV